MLERTNLRRKLEDLRDRQVQQEELLRQVYSYLEDDAFQEEQLLKRFQQETYEDENHFLPDLLETHRIFHLDQIRTICIEYRLRFLETKFFKAPIPKEALLEISRLEQNHQTSLQGFRVMAPSKHFKLENADDPILFAPIGNNYFYLIHQWGKDLHPFRKLMMWPLKSIENLLVFTLFFSFILTLGISQIFYAGLSSPAEFILLFLFTFKSVIGLILFYGIALGKNFNSAIWKSRFYNHP